MNRWGGQRWIHKWLTKATFEPMNEWIWWIRMNSWLVGGRGVYWVLKCCRTRRTTWWLTHCWFSILVILALTYSVSARPVALWWRWKRGRRRNWASEWLCRRLIAPSHGFMGGVWPSSATQVTKAVNYDWSCSIHSILFLSFGVQACDEFGVHSLLCRPSDPWPSLYADSLRDRDLPQSQCLRFVQLCGFGDGRSGGSGGATAAVESFGLQVSSRLDEAFCSGFYSFSAIEIGEIRRGEVVLKQPGEFVYPSICREIIPQSIRSLNWWFVHSFRIHSPWLQTSVYAFVIID